MTTKREIYKAPTHCQAVIDLPVANALRGLIEGLPEALLLLTLDGRIFAANKAAISILNAEQAAIVGAPFSILVEEEAQTVETVLHRAAESLPAIFANFTVCMDCAHRKDCKTVEMRLNQARLGREIESPLVLIVRLNADAGKVVTIDKADNVISAFE